MKFSQKWVQEWLTFETSTNEMAHQLTMAGLEVDDVKPVSGDFSGVFVGKVVECRQHPNADKLQITKVDIGQNNLLDIVCGAKNCRQNLMVAVATVGAILPENFKITKENWSNSEVVNFCIYFMEYTPRGELSVLEKFLST